MLFTKFQVNYYFGSGEVVKNRFSKWPKSRPSLISDLVIFLSTSHLDASYQVSSQLSFRRKRRKVDFQEWRPSWNTDRNGLAIFDLQVTRMLSKRFQVIWPFGSEAEAKNRFPRWRPWRPSSISEWNNFSYFWFTSHLNASYRELFIGPGV